MRINKAWKDGGSRLKLGKPKTTRGIRTVSVPLVTLDRLDLSRDPDELLFCTKHGTPITAFTSTKRRGSPPCGGSMRSPAAVAFERPIGGKRIILDNEYYPTLTQPNVELITAPITRLTSDGLDTTDGEHHHADVLIFATGSGHRSSSPRSSCAAETDRRCTSDGVRVPQRSTGWQCLGFRTPTSSPDPTRSIPREQQPDDEGTPNRLHHPMLARRDEIGATAIEVDNQVMQTHKRWMRKAIAETVWPNAGPSWYKHPSGAVTIHCPTP